MLVFFLAIAATSAFHQQTFGRPLTTVRRLSPDQMTPEQMKMSADMFKNLDGEQIAKMLDDMENMSAAEKEQYQKMGVNMEMLKMSMRTLKNNPKVLELARKQMGSMSPEQMAQASRMAAQQFKGVSPNDFEKMASEAAAQIDSVPTTLETPAPTAAQTPAAATARDAPVIDAMFAVAQYSANPPDGTVDLATFSTLPPIAALRGDQPDDLSDEELKQVWESEADGKARVNRAEFEKVWLGIDDFYEEDLLVEARRPPKKTAAAQQPPQE